MPMFALMLRVGGSAALSFMLMGKMALAHHVLGFRLPATFLEGLVSGFSHPLIGVDHLAAIIAVGALAASYARGWMLPLLFAATGLIGVVLHLMSIDLAAGELAIALTVAAMGILLMGGVGPSLKLFAVLTAITGLFHGYGYGESIIGASPAPLGAYLLGLAIVQAGTGLAALVAVKAATIPWLTRAVGACVLVIGVASFAVLG